MIFKKNMGHCCLPLQGLEHDEKLIESEFEWGKIELLPILSYHVVQAGQISVQISCETLSISDVVKPPKAGTDGHLPS